MATVTGLTADRMLEIEAESIVGGFVRAADGHLILTRHDTTTIDAGPVIANGLFVDIVSDQAAIDGLKTFEKKVSVELAAAGPAVRIGTTVAGQSDALNISPYGAASVVFASGAEWTGAGSTARAASASQIELLNGTVSWYSDTGLVAGNAYARTKRMGLDSSGIQINGGDHYLGVNAFGAAGSRLHVFTNGTIDVGLFAESSGVDGNLTLRQKGAGAIQLQSGTGANLIKVTNDGVADFTGNAAVAANRSGIIRIPYANAIRLSDGLASFGRLAGYSAGGVELSENLFWDGSGSWMRDDTTKSGMRLLLTNQGNPLQLSYTPAGANPAVTSLVMQLDSAGGLQALSGKFGSGIFGAGGTTSWVQISDYFGDQTIVAARGTAGHTVQLTFQTQGGSYINLQDGSGNNKLRIDGSGTAANNTPLIVEANVGGSNGQYRIMVGTALGAAANGVPTGGKILYLP